jgi:hypothetical protein
MASAGAQGQAAPPNVNAGADGKNIDIARATSTPVVDGKLDDAIWTDATLIEDLHQMQPVEYAPPTERTEIRVAYDDDALYIAAKLWYRDPADLTAQVLRQGEALNNEDRLAVVLDPYLDKRNGYRFEVNANGVRWDALYQNTTNVESNWDGIWLAASQRDADGWTTEISIPFKTLSFNPNNDAWGMNFERAIQRHDEILGWVSRNRQLNPGVAGTATGFHDLQQGMGLDVVPSMSVTERKYYVSGESTSDAEPSLDVFYKITPSLNGSLTINTDFSATEVDDRQVNLTRFSLFFPEKRDFFLQDADIFEFGRIGGGGGGGGGGPGGGGGGGGGGGCGGPGGGNASAQNGRPFFSRTIGLSSTGQPVDIEYGGKMSGRVGRWNVGALAIHQGEQLDTAGNRLVDDTDIFVGRVAANVLDESTLGMIVTDGDPQSNIDNSLLGADFRYRNSRLPGGRVLEGETWYQETDTAGFVGDNRAFGFGLSSPNNTGLRGGIDAKQIEQNFNPAVGFVNEAGIRHYNFDFGYRYRYRDRILRSVYGGVEGSRVERLDTGGLDRQDFGLRLNIEGVTQERGVFAITTNEENLPSDFTIYTESDGSRSVVIPAGHYQWTGMFMGARTGSHRKISGFLGFNAGEYYDGDRTEARTELDWRPTQHLRLGVSYSANDVSLPDGDFTVRISTLRAQYAFSSQLSWVNLVQYDNVSENLGFNSRLHWIPQAGREGFIVLNHSLTDADKNDSFHSLNADAAIKFSYTFRF